MQSIEASGTSEAHHIGSKQLGQVRLESLEEYKQTWFMSHHCTLTELLKVADKKEAPWQNAAFYAKILVVNTDHFFLHNFFLDM